MKKIVFFIAILSLSAFISMAQKIEIDTISATNNATKDNSIRTIFGKKQTSGGYFAFTINYASVDQRDGMRIGGRGGWIVNHNLGIGLCGYGFFNEGQQNLALRLDPDYKYSLNGGYGGIFIEPIIGAKSPVHISIPIVLGGGGVAYTSSYANYDWDHNSKWKDNIEDSKAFFIVEPGLELEFNLVRYFRLSFGAYYRYCTNVEMKTVSYEDNKPLILTKLDAINGFSFGVNLKFGLF